MNWKVISRNIGFALLVSALFMFFSIIVSVINGNDSALAALIISCTITFLVGAFPFIFVKKTKRISLKEGYVIITLSWFLSFIFGMLPYALWGGPFTIQNAFFESVSGYTTCGATILDDVEALPNSLLFWRSSTHFIGGLGVIVFLLFIIPESSPMRMRLTNMEVSSLSKSGYSLRSGKVVYVFAYVYLGLFALALLAYWAAGMSFFDAINHAMSVVATGGFSTKTISIAAFDSRLIEGITMLFMYLSSIHFGLIYLAVITKSWKPLNNEVIRWYTIGIVAVSLFLSIGFLKNDICDTWLESIWVAFFNTISFVSTTGFGIIDNALWPTWMVMMICMVSIVSGCAGSTSGGIKVDRCIIFIKSIAAKVREILHPSTISEVRIQRRIIRTEDVSTHILYICVFCFFALFSTVIVSCSGMPFRESLFSTVMCLSNVGPGCGDFSIMASYNSAPFFGKIVFALDMFLGRVEIYPILALFAMLFDRRK